MIDWDNSTRVHALQAEIDRRRAELATKDVRIERAKAEAKAMREALEPFVTTAEKFGTWDDNQRVNLSIKLGHLRKAGAALAPSPAGREN